MIAFSSGARCERISLRIHTVITAGRI